ncbi:DnaJ domain-containing protein [bacterium]|nr:DnaJ domain-containing protein [bacterium]
MDNFTIGLRFGGGAVGFANGVGGVNACMFPACQQILQTWMPCPGNPMMPGYLQAPPFFYPMPPNMGGYPMPNPGWGAPFPFQHPFQDMCPAPYQPPCNPGYGGYQPSIPNYGAGYRYPEYGQIQQRARENGTLDGTPVTPHSSFHEDQFHTDALSRLNQRAAGRVMQEAQAASPREFNALQRNEGQLQGYLQQQTEQGRGFSGAEVHRMRAEGIENLYQDGQVGQGIGQANREHLELLEAWERSEANQQMKYGVGPMPGLSPRAYQESPFNPQRQAPQRQQGQSQPPAQSTQPQYRPQPRPTAQPQQDIRRLDYPDDKPKAAPAKPAAAKPAPTQNAPAKPNAQQQPATPAKPAPKPYDPNKDSNELYKAMHGGLGLGTDEGALFKALDGKSKEQIDKLKANYKDHYGKDLNADLKSELSGKDFQRAEALMKGNQSAADATALQQSVGVLWNDNKDIHKTLEGKTAEQRKAIAEEYKKQTGKELKTQLSREMSGTDKDQAMALLDGNTAKADAAKIQRAVKGAGTDEAAIMGALEGKSKTEREAIAKSFKDTYKVDLTQRLKEDMGGAELDQANALMEGNQSKAAAAKIKTATEGFWGADKTGINDSLQGKSVEERKAITDAYKQTYGKELNSELKDRLSGNDLQKSEALLQRGKLTDAEQLKFALEGAGTDEEAVKKALQGKTKEEVAQIRKDYEGLTQRKLDDDIAGDMSGREHFDAKMALRGRAETVDEAVARANEVHEFERKGDGNFVSRNLVDLVSDKGELLDKNTDRVNESKNKFDRLVAEGRLDEAKIEKKRLQELTGFATADVESYRETKDSAADTAGTVAATAAGVAVVVASAGTATPLVAVAAMAAGAGAGARVVTTGLIKGEGYGVEDALLDAGQGAIDGGTSIIGMGGVGASAKVAVKAGQEGAELAAREALVAGGKVVVKAGQEGTELVAKQALLKSGQEGGELALITTGKAVANKAQERLVIQGAGDILEKQGSQFVKQRVIQGAKDGVKGGAIGAGASEMIHDGTWDNGLADGLTRVATSTAIGAGAGGLAGGGMSHFGAAREWTGEVDLYRNKANFSLLDDAQKVKFAGLADNYSKGAAFVDGGPTQNVDDRLIKMLRDGTVDKVDDSGATVVDNLARLDGQQMAKGLTNRGVMDEVLETVTKPGVIHQDTKGSCTVTTLEYLHVKKDPSHFIKTVGDLTSESGETTLKNGERIIRNPTGLKADGTSRSGIDRIYQSTMMDYGGGGHYDNIKDGHIMANGKSSGSGLYAKGYSKVEDGVLGGQWENRAFDKVNGGTAAREAFESQVNKAAEAGEHVPISMKFANNAEDMHSNHMLSVYKTDDEFVYMRNPWGKGDKGSLLNGGPTREMLDNQGNFRMKKSDFYDRLNGYDVQVSTRSTKVDAEATRTKILDRFRQQAKEFSDDGWKNSTPKDVWERWTPEQQEFHRTKLHDRAANIVKDLEGGGDVYDVAGKYNLSDHYGLGDKQGRSEQFINRTEGGSNVYGKSKVAAEPPPIPKEGPRPQPAPKPEPPPQPRRLTEVRMPTSAHDAYRTLGLSPGASKEEVVQAYRKLAAANHPDKFPNQVDQATKNMQAINVAKDLLR